MADNPKDLDEAERAIAEMQTRIEVLQAENAGLQRMIEALRKQLDSAG